jgi:anti-anti-sigma factor
MAMGIRQTCQFTGEVDCTVTRDEKGLLVTFGGAVDFYTAGRAKKVLLDLLDHEPAVLVIDVKDTFVDSSGIGVFVHVAQRARMERREFRLLCDEPLAWLLRVHRLDRVLGIGDVESGRFAQTDPIAA